ncbi:MAG: hypothetical protein ACRDUW_06080 [Pseudonocardiaceae bacterium]
MTSRPPLPAFGSSPAAHPPAAGPRTDPADFPPSYLLGCRLGGKGLLSTTTLVNGLPGLPGSIPTRYRGGICPDTIDQVGPGRRQ